PPRPEGALRDSCRPRFRRRGRGPDGSACPPRAASSASPPRARELRPPSQSSGPPGTPRRAPAARPGTRSRPVARRFPQRALELGARAGEDIGGFAGECLRLGVGDLGRAKPLGDLAKPLARSVQFAHVVADSRAAAPRMPLTKPGVSTPQYSL